MRQSLVIGNWKMHGSIAANDALLMALLAELPKEVSAKIAVCPPAIYLMAVAEKLKGTKIAIGAQNVCAEAQESGAYTGEVSASMLAEIDCQYVLVGHSERREYYSEDNDCVANKFAQVQSESLLPVLCVGENLTQREQGETLEFIASQIKAVINKAGIAAFNHAVIAYEPIWAIGTGETASPEQAQEVHAYIRGLIASYDAKVAEKIQLLYGGSVKADNAASLFAMADIDGALVGGAALNAESFSTICKTAK